jgi:predicted RNase H-like nuclease (RuvC/YqgF family)
MGSQPSAPTLDTNQSKALTQADYTLKIQNTPQLVEATGKAGREEYARNLEFALRGFTNPASIVYGGQIEDLRESNVKLTERLEKTKDSKERARIQKQIDDNSAKVSSLNKIIREDPDRPVNQLKSEFSQQFRMRDNLLGDMRDAE